MIERETVESIKVDFHVALQTLRYDLGGSTADLVEDLLASVLRKYEGR